MRKRLIAVIVLLFFVLVAILFASTTFAAMAEDGLAVPAEGNVARSIVQGDAPIQLKQLEYGDVVYRSLSGYFVGKEREHIDLTYPLYINGGAGVRFWNEENWLITTNVEMFRSFSGLYLTEGTTYNADMGQADEGEFILVMLPNGLYMNAQKAVFRSAAGEVALAANSVLSMTEGTLSWYQPDGQALVYGREAAIMGATLTIGGHTYDYWDLLKALGLLQKAAQDAQGPVTDPALQQEAAELLDPDQEAADNRYVHRENGQGNRPGAGRVEEAGAAGNANDPGDQGAGDSEDLFGGGSDHADRNPGKGDTSGDHSGEQGSGSGQGSGSQNPGSGSDQDGQPDSESGPPNTEDGDGSGEEDLEYVEPVKPVVTIQGIEPWSYAIGLNAEIEDPAGTMVGGVSYAVYRSINGSGATGTLEGYTTYPAAVDGKGYTGRNMVLRRSSGSDALALSTLQPGQKFYLQYSFIFNEKVGQQEKTDDQGNIVLDKDGKPVMEDVFVRSSHVSELVEVTLPGLEQNVHPVASDWQVQFAPYADALVLEHLTMKNTSDYDPEEEPFTFENFKKNTLLFVDHYEILLTEAGDSRSQTRITVGGNTLRQAQALAESGGTAFHSTSPKLKSNMHYNYTVTARDQYGNAIPMERPGGSSGQLYTRKATPSVTITEEENVMDRLKLKIQVSDPDGALSGEDLRFQIRETDAPAGATVKALLEGTWTSSNGEAIRYAQDGQDKTILLLPSPADGVEYTLDITSLAFSCLYTAEVFGDVDPQPSAVTSPRLETEEGKLVGRLNVYTASLTSGMVSFQTGTADLLDTSVTIHATMGRNTVRAVLELVDEFIVNLVDEDGNVVPGPDGGPLVTLRTGDMRQNTSYDTALSGYTILDGTPPMPDVVLRSEDIAPGSSAWESFCIQSQTDQEGNVTYSTPMTLEIRLPDNSLQTDTAYTYSVQAVVHKSGKDYYIPVDITNNSFTTKKTIPEIRGLENLFLAADKAEFPDLRIYDPDGTIGSDGKVMIYLYYQNEDGTQTRLQAKEITAMRTDDGVGEKLNFEGLIPGGVYHMHFVALEYNDARGYAGYEQNKHLRHAPVVIVGGSELQGKLTVSRLGDEYQKDEAGKDQKTGFKEAVVDITVTDAKGYLGKPGETPEIQVRFDWDDSVELPAYGLPPKELCEEMLSQPLTAVKDSKGEILYYALTLPLTETTDSSGKTIYTLNYPMTMSALPINDSWRLTLMTTYRGNPVTLDQIELVTDANYVVVTSHMALYKAQQSGASNILVTQGFDLDPALNRTAAETDSSTQNLKSNFQGTIDFQGNVIRKPKEYNNFFLSVGSTGVVKNLVFDYPEESSYENTRAVFHDIQGTVENVIIRTHGEVIMSNQYDGLLAHRVTASGKLRNFIVKLGGDLVYRASGTSYMGSIVSGDLTSGLIENGYLYAVPGAGVVMNTTGTGGNMFGRAWLSSNIRNLYILTDSWYQDGVLGRLLDYNEPNSANMSNIYAVGDYYTINAGELKHNNNRKDQHYLIRETSSPVAYKNIWAITANSYPENAGVVKVAKPEVLYDPAWQASVLGPAFDTQSCIEMGFYPRLNLPGCMQKYQEYIELPERYAANTPEIVADDWADPQDYGQPKLDEGVVRLRFKAPINLHITGVTIPGLDTSVRMQEFQNGFLDVYLDVKAAAQNPQYLSKYEVTAFDYTLGSNEGSIDCSYFTKNIEFWKAVATPQDWTDINLHMNWNYKLITDISLKGRSPNQVMLDGDVNKLNGTSNFGGKLDGGEHVVSDIELRDIQTPYVIYEANQTQIRNLFFENVYISSSTSANSYAGIIRSASAPLLENIRVRNSQVYGGSAVGTIVANMSSGLMRNCSVTDAVVGDVETGRELLLGGIVGTTTGNLEFNYTRNVSIVVDESMLVLGVGGLAGRHQGACRDSYTNGTITAKGNYVGGITGAINPTGFVTRCWSDVDIFHNAGNSIGGLSGGSCSPSSAVALGDVISTGTTVRRLGGSTGYVYAGQTVSGLEPGEKGSDTTVYFLTAEELAMPTTWQDTVRLGGAFDYRPVPSGNAPLLAAEHDTSREGWGQKNIGLPGQGRDPVLTVNSAIFNDAAADGMKYFIRATLEHPDLALDFSTPEGAAQAAQQLDIQLEGFNLSSSNASGYSISLSDASDVPNTGPTHKTQITIQAKNFEYAFDSYTLNVAYSGRVIRATVQFEVYNSGGTIHRVYHTVSTAAEWMTLMATHGTTMENFRINGMLDFTGYTDFPKGLRLNRLEGANTPAAETLVKHSEVGHACPDLVAPGDGFQELNFHGDEQGTPMIEQVAVELGGLTFRHVSFDFRSTATERTMTGAILTVGTIRDLYLDQVHITVNQNTRSKVGFVSNASGNVRDVHVESSSLTDIHGEQRTPAGKYGAIFLAVAKGDTNHITGRDLTVNMPQTSYLGSLYGSANASQSFRSYCCRVEGFQVQGAGYTGALAGEISSGSVSFSKVIGTEGANTVQGTDRVGGMGGSMMNYGEYGRDMLVENVFVKATTGSAGGLHGGNGTWPTHQRVTVKDCTIEGNTFAGGMAGSSSASVWDVRVSNCTIRCTGTGTAGDANISRGAGGIVGQIHEQYNPQIHGAVVENTTIEGPANVGGAIGYFQRANSSMTFSNVYVGQDVTVSAAYNSAGGLVGSANWITLSNSISGATVTAGTEAGGAVGRVRVDSGVLRVALKNVLYQGKVTASGDYAAGLVGRLNDSNVKYDDSFLSGCAVAAEVNCGGSSTGMEISAWINDDAKNTPAGSGLVYISEETTLNGQSIKNLKAVADANGTVSVNTQGLLPPRFEPNLNLMRPASEFATREFYTDILKVKESCWDLSHLGTAGNLYMPFARNRAGTATAQLSADSSKILLPRSTELPGVVVYASGADRVNIEIPNYPSLPQDTRPASVTVGTETVPLDANGVGVAAWNGGDLVVNGETFQGEELRRVVMTHGSHWYFLQNGGEVHYGDNDTYLGKLEGVSGAVHLWRGKALTAEGTVVDLTTLEATGPTTQPPSEEDPGNPGTEAPETPAVPEAPPLWQTDNGSVKTYRTFSISQNVRKPYQIFLMGDVTYTVSPSQQVVHDGIFLGEVVNLALGGKYFTLLGEDGKITSYIKQMSLDSLDRSDEKIGVVQMSNTLSGYAGQVLVVRYADGAIAAVNFTTGQPLYSTMSILEQFAVFVSNAFDELWADITAETEDYDSSFQDSLQLQVALTQAGTIGLPEGEVGIPTDDAGQTDAQAGDSGGEPESASGDPLDLEGEAEAGGEAGGGTAAVSGESAGISGDSGSGTAAASGGSQASGASGGSGGTVILYSEETGRYELMDADSVDRGEPQRVEDLLKEKEEVSLAQRPEEEPSSPAPAETTAPGSDFQVNQMGTIALYASEKQGFLFIGLAAAAAVLGLLLLYLKVIRKK